MAKKILVLVMGLMLIAGLVLSGCAAEKYPARDIKCIVGWAAGGGTDTNTRGIANYAQEYLGVEIFVENIKGGSSGIGAYEVMVAEPDGYTIGAFTWDAVVTVPRKDIIKVYDLDKIEWLCTYTAHPLSLAVLTDAPWQTLDDFVADAKSRPGEIKTAGAGSLGGMSHLSALVMGKGCGIELFYIPISGGDAPMREALLGGEVEAAVITVGGALPGIQSGDMRFLAIMGAERFPLFPDVPTFKELGYDVVSASFRAMGVPKGTPQDRVDLLVDAFDKAWHNPEYQAWVDTVGGGALWNDSAATAEYIQTIQKAAIAVAEEFGV